MDNCDKNLSLLSFDSAFLELDFNDNNNYKKPSMEVMNKNNYQEKQQQFQ